MSQNLRDMLANRKFAIPLIILLAFCLIGLILVGVVLILRPGAPTTPTPVAQVTDTPEVTKAVTVTSAPSNTPTSRASATLVPLGTPVTSVPSGQGTPAATETATVTPPPTATGASAAAATATPQGGGQLADTGVGWGLILASGAGLAALVIVARRLRLAR